MNKFFDIEYYVLCKLYAQYKQAGSDGSASGIVGGVQAMNVIMLLMTWAICSKQKGIFTNKISFLIIVIAFQIYSYIRYIYKDNHSWQVIEKVWDGKSTNWQNSRRWLVGIHVIGTFIMTFALAIYLGGQHY